MVSDYSTCYGGKGVTGFWEVWKLAFVKTEDWKTLQILIWRQKTSKMQASKTEDLATKPEDSRLEFLTGKIRVWWTKKTAFCDTFPCYVYCER